MTINDLIKQLTKYDKDMEIMVTALGKSEPEYGDDGRPIAMGSCIHLQSSKIHKPNWNEMIEMIILF